MNLLKQRGLFNSLLLERRGGRHHKVSERLVARALGARLAPRACGRVGESTQMLPALSSRCAGGASVRRKSSLAQEDASRVRALFSLFSKIPYFPNFLWVVCTRFRHPSDPTLRRGQSLSTAVILTCDRITVMVAEPAADELSSVVYMYTVSPVPQGCGGKT
jgi:hypothetical protein